MADEQWQFEAYARLVTLLGDELIESPSVALYELCKNAYDADARKVEVCLDGTVLTDDEARDLLADADTSSAKPGRAARAEAICRIDRISVSDDGHGMTKDELHEGWMRLGISGKAKRGADGQRSQQRSRSGRRVMLGEKGVGRLAAARLGDHMTLKTRRAGSSTLHVLDVDWGAYEAAGGSLSQTSGGASYRTRRLPSERWWNTRIEIKDLRAPHWSEADLQNLQFNLAALQGPVPEQTEFEVRLIAPIPVAAPGLDLADRSHYTVSAEVREEAGKWVLHGSLRARYYEHEETIRAELSPDIARCGPLAVDLHIFERRPQDLREAEISRDEAKLLQYYAGISIYRDGFRVLPYGMPDNDWLRLDQRRSTDLGRYLSNRQVIGRIHISAQRNPRLRDQTHRQGLIDNEAFRAFKDAVLALIHQVEIRRVRLRKGQRPRVSLSALGSSLKTISSTVETYGSDEEKAAAGNMRAWYRDVEERLDLYMRVAASGVAAQMALHDMDNALRKLRYGASTTVRFARQHTPTQRVAEACDELEAAVAILSAAFSVLRPIFARGRQRTTSFALAEATQDVIRLFDFEPQRDSVVVRVDIPPDLTVAMVPGHLSQILLNLLDNSFYWLRADDNEREGEAAQRVIQIRARPSKDAVRLELTNSGPPIPEDEVPYVTEPFYTTKKERDARGLGLYIVADTLANMERRLVVEPSGPLGGPVFAFDLPRGETDEPSAS